jgi:hypothetical protein
MTIGGSQLTCNPTMTPCQPIPPTRHDVKIDEPDDARHDGIYYSSLHQVSVYFIVSNLLGIAQYAMMGNVHWSNLLPKRSTVKAK